MTQNMIFREALGISISCPLQKNITNDSKSSSFPFERIIWVALDPWSDALLSDAIDNIFASLSLFEVKGMNIRTIALPLICTGDMGLSPNTILNASSPTRSGT
jgi:hypothetical protein